VKKPVPDYVIAIIFLAVTLASRIPSFGQSVLDWDESLYFLMAQQWRLGHLPYTTVWDNKPIGIYVIFAAFQSILGERVAAMRFATVVFVSLLAFTVYRITTTITSNRLASLLAGAALILCSLSNDGLAANTELFMASFTALAVLTALTTGRGFLVGLCIGAAFMIKYVAVFEAPFVFFLLLARTRRIVPGITMIIGAAVPLAAVVLLYAAAGDLSLWWQSSVISNFRRVSVAISASNLDYALTMQAWRWSTLYLAALGLAVLLLVRRKWTPEAFLPFWLAGGLLGVISSKSFYDHYFLQLLPVLCVILGVCLRELQKFNILVRAGFAVAVLALPAWAAETALQSAAGPDVTAQVAADITAANPVQIYVFDSQPILYALTGQTPPTEYVLPSELTGNSLARVAGVNAPAEVARILASDPSMIIRRTHPETDPHIVNPAVYTEVNHDLAANYWLWKEYDGVQIYALRSFAGP
jgi:4-amino-4-deoxy-L-arabinose transferase-like glycosyltransferase